MAPGMKYLASSRPAEQLLTLEAATKQQSMDFGTSPAGVEQPGELEDGILGLPHPSKAIQMLRESLGG